MALPGISNANEFYSAHYLESVHTGDIKKVRERWAEEAKAELNDNPLAEVSTPEQRFKALRKPWQKLREAELGISGRSRSRRSGAWPSRRRSTCASTTTNAL